jgi:hypothetical protein
LLVVVNALAVVAVPLNDPLNVVAVTAPAFNVTPPIELDPDPAVIVPAVETLLALSVTPPTKLDPAPVVMVPTAALFVTDNAVPAPDRVTSPEAPTVVAPDSAPPIAREVTPDSAPAV